MKRRKKHFWYDWKIYHKYLNWRFKRKVESGEVLYEMMKMAEDMLAFRHFINDEVGPKLMGCQPMPTPTSPIFTLKFVKAEKEFKDGEGI